MALHPSHRFGNIKSDRPKHRTNPGPADSRSSLQKLPHGASETNPQKEQQECQNSPERSDELPLLRRQNPGAFLGKTKETIAPFLGTFWTHILSGCVCVCVCVEWLELA